MALKSLNINGVTASIPIIQGAMGIGGSLSRPAGAVAAEGGAGVISAVQPDFSRDGFYSNPLKANPEALAYHIEGAKCSHGRM